MYACMSNKANRFFVWICQQKVIDPDAQYVRFLKYIYHIELSERMFSAF